MANISKSNVRTRFAPAPTGIMHIGNVRAALLNYLFARQKNGTFILRIEDTDAERMYDTGAKEILYDLAWLGLEYDEGPIKGGAFGPYFQSERSKIYAKALNFLIDKNLVYRCFCTAEELDKKRQRQLALKQPPRYDKACVKLTPSEIEDRLVKEMSFIWRFNIPSNQDLVIVDLAKGRMVFNSNNLTDFPLTRTDGSFTFIFANAIDDIKMEMSHVFRGEDHLTNSASQLLIYKAFERPEPVFLHLPIICNLEGKKLSKRDFGFSIKDLQNDGFLPEAICNYLGILGGSYKEEIMSLEELIKEYNFDHISSTSQIKYDPDKLKWVNHKWLQRLSTQELAKRALPFLLEAYPEAKDLAPETLERLIDLVKTDIITLKDLSAHIGWYFGQLEKPTPAEIDDFTANKDKLIKLFTNIGQFKDGAELLEMLKNGAKDLQIPTKTLMQTSRFIFTGSTKGPNIKEIVDILGNDKVKSKISKFLNSF